MRRVGHRQNSCYTIRLVIARHSPFYDDQRQKPITNLIECSSNIFSLKDHQNNHISSSPIPSPVEEEKADHASCLGVGSALFQNTSFITSPTAAPVFVTYSSCNCKSRVLIECVAINRTININSEFLVVQRLVAGVLTPIGCLGLLGSAQLL